MSPNQCGLSNLTVNVTQENNDNLSTLLKIPITVVCVNDAPSYDNLTVYTGDNFDVIGIANSTTKEIFLNEDDRVKVVLGILDNDTFTNMSLNFSNDVWIYYVNDTNAISVSNYFILNLSEHYSDYFGIINLQVNFTDGFVNSSVDVVFNISSVNDVPRLNTTYIDTNTTFNEDTDSVFNLSAFAYDVEGDAMNISILFSNNLWAQSISYDEITGMINLTPKQDLYGIFNLTFNATDFNNASVLLRILTNITPTNDMPRINITSFNVFEDQQTLINYSELMYDVDNVTLEFTLINMTDYAYMNDSSSLMVIAPTTNNDSMIWFNLTSFDGEYYTSTLFNVTFVSVNDNFTSNTSLFSGYTFVQDGSLVINLSKIFVDEENNLTYIVVNKSSANINAIILDNGLYNASLVFSSSVVSTSYGVIVEVFDGLYGENVTFTTAVTAKPYVPSGESSGGSSRGGSGGMIIPVVPVPSTNVTKNDTVVKPIQKYNDIVTFETPIAGQVLTIHSSLPYIDSLTYKILGNVGFNITIKIKEIPITDKYGKFAYKAIEVDNNIPLDFYGGSSLLFNVPLNWFELNDLNMTNMKVYAIMPDSWT